MKINEGKSMNIEGGRRRHRQTFADIMKIEGGRRENPIISEHLSVVWEVHQKQKTNYIKINNPAIRAGACK